VIKLVLKELSLATA